MILATGADDNQVIIHQNSDFEILQPNTTKTNIKSLAFISKTLLASGEYKILKIWNLVTKKCIKELNHPSWIENILFIPPNFLLSSSMNRVYLWNTDRFQLIKNVKLNGFILGLCNYQKDEILILEFGNRIHRYNYKESSLNLLLEFPVSFSTGFCKLHGEKRFAVGVDYLGIHIYEGDTLIMNIKSKNDDIPIEFGLLPNGNLLVTSRTKSATLWDVKNGKKIKEFVHDHCVETVSVLDDETFVTGDWKGSICVWNTFGILVKKMKRHQKMIGVIRAFPKTKIETMLKFFNKQKDMDIYFSFE